MYRYVRRRLGDELAAEVAAETFLQAFRSRGRFIDGEASVLAVAVWDRRQPGADEPPHGGAAAAGLRWAAAGLSGYEPATAVEDRLDAEALGPALALALAGLSPALREVLVLHAWAELSHEEIAEALGCSSAAVRTRLSRARSRLAAGLAAPITTEVEER